MDPLVRWPPPAGRTASLYGPQHCAEGRMRGRKLGALRDGSTPLPMLPTCHRMKLPTCHRMRGRKLGALRDGSTPLPKLQLATGRSKHSPGVEEGLQTAFGRSS
eukprot:362725-Chlamydomonas_euryale.AAC.1